MIMCGIMHKSGCFMRPGFDVRISLPRHRTSTRAPSWATPAGGDSHVGERRINVAVRQSTPRNHTYGAPTPGAAYGRERPPTPLRTPGLPAPEAVTKISCPPRRLVGFPWGTSKLVLVL